jgi:hypothetical protein
MSDEIPRLTPGRPLEGIPAGAWNRFRSATLAVEQGADAASGTPARPIVSGIVKEATAATWDNATNTLTYGEITIYPIASYTDDGWTIDRAADTLAIKHDYTTAPSEGALVRHQRGRWIVLTCEPLDGWS